MNTYTLTPKYTHTQTHSHIRHKLVEHQFFQIDLRVAKSVTCGLALSRELLIGSSVGAGEDFSYKIIAIVVVIVIVTIIVVVVIFIIVTLIIVTSWAREMSMVREMRNGIKIQIKLDQVYCA